MKRQWGKRKTKKNEVRIPEESNHLGGDAEEDEEFAQAQRDVEDPARAREEGGEGERDGDDGAENHGEERPVHSLRGFGA